METESVRVVRGGKALLRKRGNLAAAGLTQAQWRAEWEAARLFLTADGEKDKAWGNETIRWNPGEGWLRDGSHSLAHLANRATRPAPRLSAPVGFSYGAARSPPRRPPGRSGYDVAVTRCGAGGMWTRRWKAAPAPAPCPWLALRRTRCWRST